MNKPSIIFLIDGLKFGGAERSLLEIAKRFVKYKPIFYVTSNSLELLQEYRDAGLEVIHFPLPRNYRFEKNAKKLWDKIKDHNPVIIHSTLFYSDMTLRYLKTDIIKVNSLVSNSYSPRRMNQLSIAIRFKVWMLKLWDILSCNMVDCFISNSQVIKTSYIKETKIKESKIKVIYRGRDPMKFQKRAVIESKLPQDPMLLSVGRLIPSKGFAGLIEVFSKFRSQFPGATLTIAGAGPEREELIKIVKGLNLNDSVHLLGSIQNISNELLKANLFIFPTFFEGLPGALIEAMMAKVPIICSDIPENKECLSQDMCLFHKVGDWDDLYNVMEKAFLLGDWDERTKKAYEFAIQNFEINKIVNQYEALYDQLIDKV